MGERGLGEGVGGDAVLMVHKNGSGIDGDFCCCYWVFVVVVVF